VPKTLEEIRSQSMTLRCAVCNTITGSISNQVAVAEGQLSETMWQVQPCEKCLHDTAKRVREENARELQFARHARDLAEGGRRLAEAERDRYRAALRRATNIVQILSSGEDED
jgi:hypothetical protein